MNHGEIREGEQKGFSIHALKDMGQNKEVRACRLLEEEGGDWEMEKVGARDHSRGKELKW